MASGTEEKPLETDTKPSGQVCNVLTERSHFSETALDEQGQVVKGGGSTPVIHTHGRGF